MLISAATDSGHLVGVGHSSAWLVSGDRFTSVLGGKQASDSGVASSAVAALPRVPNRLEPTVEVRRQWHARFMSTPAFLTFMSTKCATR
jgi:hypothetical protein